MNICGHHENHEHWQPQTLHAGLSLPCNHPWPLLTWGLVVLHYHVEFHHHVFTSKQYNFVFTCCWIYKGTHSTYFLFSFLSYWVCAICHVGSCGRGCGGKNTAVWISRNSWSSLLLLDIWIAFTLGQVHPYTSTLAFMALSFPKAYPQK